MHNLLTYLLCASLISLVSLSIFFMKRISNYRKLITINGVINENRIQVTELGNVFNLIFVDPSSEQAFIDGSGEVHNKCLIFYQAPNYRVKLFEKKISSNMRICNDYNKILLSNLEIRSFPCLVEVNLSKFELRKNYGG